MALKTVIVSANGERKLLDLMVDRALVLKAGEQLVVPPGLLKKKLADEAAAGTGEVVLTDAEGQTYTVFLSADSELVVAQGMEVAQAGGTYPTNPNSIPSAPPTVSTIPLPTNPKSYSSSTASESGGAADYLVPIGLGVLGVGAIVALAAQSDDDDEGDNNIPTPIPNNTVFGGTVSGSVTEAGIGGAGVPGASGQLTADDPDGPDNSFVAASGTTTYGSYTLSANGAWTYLLNNGNGTVEALNNGQTLPDSFTAMTADGSTRAVNITINGASDVGLPNNTTISGDVLGEVVEAGAVNAGTPSDTGSLLADDADGPDNSFTASSGTSVGGYGTFTVSQSGVWTYNLLNDNATVEALNNGDTLPDSFVVSAADGSTQTVSITISGANDVGEPNNSTIGGTSIGAVRESGFTAGGVADPGVGSASGTLTSTDPDGPDNTFTASSGTSANGYGTFSITAGGVWTYVLTNDNPTVNSLSTGSPALTDSFTVAAADGTTQVVSITITGTNDAPLSVADSYNAGGDALVVPALTGVLANDADPENNPITAVLVSDVANGTLSLSADGSFTYTADVGFNGADSFTYRTDDGSVGGNTVTVTINVAGNNDAPVANDDSVSGDEGAAITTGDVLVNDTDDIDDALSIISFTQGANGTVVNNGDGTFTYTAADPNFNGTDSFTYTVEDSGDLTDTATVTVTVNAVNDAPVNTLPDSYTTSEDTPLLLTGLSVSDVDVGDGDLTVTLSVDSGSLNVANATDAVSGNGSGAVTITGTPAAVNGLLGGVTFTPAADATAAVTLTLNTSDNGNAGSPGAQTDSDSATITITPVNDAPVITDGEGGAAAPDSILIDDHVENTNTVTTVTAGDVDGPGAPRFSIVGGAQGDFFTIDEVTGELNFRAPPDFQNGQGSNVPGLPNLLTPGNAYEVIVAAADGLGASDTQTITVNVVSDGSDPVLSQAPVFTDGVPVGGPLGGNNNDAGDEARIEIFENQIDVTQLFSRNSDADTPLYRIAAGEDADRFVLDPDTGVLTFVAPPDFEAPVDANGNNEYRVLVQVSDDDGTDYQLITVAIQDSTVPVAVDDADTVSEAGGFNNGTAGEDPSPVTGNVLDNDVYEGEPGGSLVVTGVGFDDDNDPDTDPINAEEITSELPVQVEGVYGTLTVQRDGSYSYALDEDDVDTQALVEGEEVAESFNYAIANEVIVGPNPNVDAATLTFTVVGANDAPFVDLNGAGAAGEDGIAVYTEDTVGGAVLIAAATVADPDTLIRNATITLTNRPDGELESLTIDGTADPIPVIPTDPDLAFAYNSTTGVLTLTGTASAAKYQAVLQTLAYQNASNTPDETDRTVTIVLNDGVEDSNVTSVQVVVNPNNDAPTVLVPTELNVNEGEEAAITGIVFADVDAGDDDVRATLAVDGGMLAATSMADVIVGGNFQTLTLTGSVADINAFIAAGNLRFTADDDDIDVNLTSTINDLGNNGSGGPQDEVAQGQTTIIVAPVNDAPTIDAALVIAVTEDVASPITGIVFDDVDAGADDVSATLSVSSGTLLAVSVPNGVVVIGSGVPSSSLTFVGSIAEINAFIADQSVSFTTALNSTEAVTLTSSISDLGNNGFGGALSADPATSTLTVTAVNDAPTVSAPADLTVAENDPTAVTGIVFADVDAGSGNVLATLSVVEGSLTATASGDVAVGGSGSTSLTLTGSIAAINAFISGSNVSFTSVMGDSTETLTSTINDQGNTGTGGAQSALVAGSTTLTITDAEEPTVEDLSFDSTSFSFFAADDDSLEGNGAGLGPLALVNDGATLNTQTVSELANAASGVYSVDDGSGSALEIAQLFVGSAANNTFTLSETYPNPVAIYGFGGEDSLTGFSGNDFLFGGDDNDTLVGGAGSDSLFGDAGDDSLSGGAGQDMLTGGADSDQFLVDSGDITLAIADVITDFEAVDDFVIFDGGPAGVPANYAEGTTATFAAASTAATAAFDSTIVYYFSETTDGNSYLFYDTNANGTFGAGDGLAVFSNNVSAADFGFDNILAG